MPGTSRTRLGAAVLESGVLLGLFLFYLGSFDAASAVNGPYEVFAQDSVYILEYLEEGSPYRWNPQSHLLYHVVLERGYDLWQPICGSGPESAYRYLKLFTALCGLSFLVGMRWLFSQLGLATGTRVALLLLSGVSVSAWFHFAAFETHVLAMPSLAIYLVALARLRLRPSRSLGDRLLLIGSLLLCGWTRIDLFRLAAASGLLLLLPSLRRLRQDLAVDLALVVLLGLAGNTWLAHVYLDLPPREAATAAFDRDDRGDLEERLGRVSNLKPPQLVTVGRAVSLYSLVMPVEARPPERSFFAPPSYELELEYSGKGAYPSTNLFMEPARNMLGAALPLLTLAGVAAALLLAGGLSLARAPTGDPLHALLVAQAVGGWLLYTWFNPFEPFLWIPEFLPLWIAMIADASRGRGRALPILLGLLALCVGIHNWFAFYLPFR